MRTKIQIAIFVAFAFASGDLICQQIPSSSLIGHTRPGTVGWVLKSWFIDKVISPGYPALVNNIDTYNKRMYFAGQARCFVDPAEFQANDAFEVVVTYLANHPEQFDNSWHDGAIEAYSAICLHSKTLVKINQSSIDKADENKARVRLQDGHAAITFQPSMKYPAQAVRQRHQGSVLLLIKLDEQGSIADVHIEKSSGFPELDRAAVENAYHSRFRPEVVNGSAVASYIRIPANFNLNIVNSQSAARQ